MTARWLLRLYPRAWRERYGAEFLVLLESAPWTMRTGLDVLRGACGEWCREGRTHSSSVFSLVRAIVGYYCASHMIAFAFHAMDGDIGSHFWSAEGLWLSAMVQLRAAIVALIVAVAVFKVGGARPSTRMTRFAREWGGGVITFGSIGLLVMLEHSGVGPDRASMASVLGQGSMVAIATVTWITMWADGVMRRAG